MKHTINTLVMMLFAASVVLIPELSCAAAGAAGTCTNQPVYDTAIAGALDSIIGDIIDLVVQALGNVSQNLYTGIVGSPNYVYATMAAMALFITFYGVSFALGLVPLSFGQAGMRLFKVGIIFMVMSPGGWGYFTQTIYTFFECGTNYLINLFMVIGQGAFAFFSIPGLGTIAMGAGSFSFLPGSCWFQDPAAPFAMLENTVQDVFSPKFFIMMIATMGTGPFGPILGMVIAASMFSLFMMIIAALEIYLLAMVIRALLYGLAPIFFVFMLFDRTKHIFAGWVNQLVNFSLQPVLLFAFLTFFAAMIQSSVDDILANTQDLCFVKVDMMAGNSPFDVQNWRFNVDGQPCEGEWTLEGNTATCGTVSITPVEPIYIIVFLVLTHIGTKMAKVVTEVAAEIASSTLYLTNLSSMQGMMGGTGGVLNPAHRMRAGQS